MPPGRIASSLGVSHQRDLNAVKAILEFIAALLMLVAWAWVVLALPGSDRCFLGNHNDANKLDQPLGASAPPAAHGAASARPGTYRRLAEASRLCPD